MAQKRMFDKSIIQNEKFMDLPMSSMALYFLLGMEADDEGFVSAKMVIRMYGGSEDDLKILIMKGFVIRFDSGVVVITDRKLNNRLDNRRIKTTQYLEEKSMIEVCGNKYVTNYAKQPLSIGCASIEESSIEESNIYSEKKIKKEINIPFEKFWELYNKKTGSKNNCLKKRSKLTDQDRVACLDFIPKYLTTIKDKQFQPYPETFLNQRRWENELKDLVGGKDYSNMQTFHEGQMNGELDQMVAQLTLEGYREMKAKRKQTDLYLKM